MAASTAAYALGEAMFRSPNKADETVSKLSGRKRRTVWLTHQPRPLYVAEAEFRAAKYFTRLKKTMLVLFGDRLMVVDVAALETADSSGSTDSTVAALRLIPYIEVLDVLLCGSATMRVEYGDSTDRLKVAGSAMLDAVSGTANISDTVSNFSVRSVPPHDSAVQGNGSGHGSSSHGSSDATPLAGATSIRVTYDSFTLSFKDPATAQQAAAALLFHRAQYAAGHQWLCQGLHAGFRCDLMSLMALPFDPEACNRSSEGQQQSQSRQRAAAAAARVGSQQPAPYPWGSSSLTAAGWGTSVPLPGSWGNILAQAAAEAAAEAADQPQITIDDLSCPLELTKGPQALSLIFSTPLGAAVATIGPQHCRALLLNGNCREVLAVPLQRSSGSSHTSSGGRAVDGAAPQQEQQSAGFSWAVNSTIPTGVSAESSAGSLAGYDLATSSSGVAVSHTCEAYAAVTIEMLQTPQSLGRKGVGRIYNPEQIQPAISAVTASTAAAEESTEPQYSNSASNWLTGAGGAASVGKQLQTLQHGLCAVMAAIVSMQLFSQPLLVVVQLALIAGLAAVTWYTSGSSSSNKTNAGQSDAGSSSSRTQQQSGQTASSPSAAVGSSSNTAAGAAAGHQPGSSSSHETLEDISCCGWSLRLVSADVVAVPGRYLQLQISMARADKGLAQLRQRIASVSFSGLTLPLSRTEGVPVLVSDPEPAWLNPDTKQRFLNAKPTLEASREQAQRTHKWRIRMDVDNVLSKPCPCFERISAAFPTYILLENSPDGHAVMLMKVGRIKDLCDLVFNPSEGGGCTLEEVEHGLSLLNEYLVRVAAPNPLPGGFQVQLYDMEGFKLSYVMGDMLTLFKMLVRFGHYYPERLHQALVINAPAWFSYPWKLMNAFLDANTSAKVVVVGNPKTALSVIAHHMGGIDNVPVAWGGKNMTLLPEFPAHKRMMQFGRQLNAGEQPLQGRG